MVWCTARIGCFVLLGAVGCATQSNRQSPTAGVTEPTATRPVSVEPPQPEGAVASTNASGVAPTLPESARATPRGESRWEVRRLEGSAAPAQVRPRRVGRRDVRFQGARLDNAFRMLAEVGRFDLVLDGDFGQTVSQVLRNVEPYDALTVLAEAHGARVGCLGGVVTVTDRQKAASSR